MNVEEAMELAKKCISEINLRFMMAMPKWNIKMVDASGITILENCNGPIDAEEVKQ